MFRFVMLALLFVVYSIPAIAAEPSSVPQQKQHLSKTIPVEMDYLLALPNGYEKQDKWPLLLFLHGSGERGSDLELVKTHGPPRRIQEGATYPMIVVSPQCPKEGRWEPLLLSALLDDIEQRYKVDPDRIYVTGLSMGGFGTFSLASHTPHRFAALVPICGGGERFMAKGISQIPIWIFHGAKDKAVPLERSEQMVEALKKQKGNPLFTVYPEAEHDSWTETYNNPDVVEWLLKQKRNSPPSKAN